MTKAEALRLARKRWGKGAFVRFDKRAPVGSVREWTKRKRAEHRKQEPPKSDRGKWWAWHKEDEDYMFRLLRNRCEIGYGTTVNGLESIGIAGFNHICGYGDTWAEAVERAGLVPKGAQQPTEAPTTTKR